MLSLIAVLLSLELGLLFSTRQFVRVADANYTSVASFEYIGESRNHAEALDPLATEAREKLARSDFVNDAAVRTWNPTRLAVGSIRRISSESVEAETLAVSGQYRQVLPYPDHAVLVLKIRAASTLGDYRSAIVYESLYSNRDYTNTVIQLDAVDFDFQTDHFYVIHGEYVEGSNAIHFKPSFYYIGQPDFIAGDLDSILNADLTGMVLDITAADSYALAEDHRFRDYAESYQMLNQSVLIRQTSALEAELSFARQSTAILEGQAFYGDKYAGENPPIIISSRLAEILEVDVGNIVALDLASQPDQELLHSYSGLEGYQNSDTFQIVGLTQELDEARHEVYIPVLEHFDLSGHNYGYHLGTVELNNESAAQWYQDTVAALDESINLSFYDQGYEQLVAPIRLIRMQTFFVLVLSIFAALLILALSAYFLVLRNKTDAFVLLRLGVSRFRSALFILYAPILLAIPAVVSGLLTGRHFTDHVSELVNRLSVSFRDFNLAYSQSGQTLDTDTAFTLSTDATVYWITACSIIFSLLILSGFLVHKVVFADFKMRKSPDKKRRRPRSEKVVKQYVSESSIASAPVYVITSLRRSKLRALLTCSVACASLASLLLLSNSELLDRQQYEEIVERSVIEGQFSSFRGNTVDNLIISYIFKRRTLEPNA